MQVFSPVSTVPGKVNVVVHICTEMRWEQKRPPNAIRCVHDVQGSRVGQINASRAHVIVDGEFHSVLDKVMKVEDEGIQVRRVSELPYYDSTVVVVYAMLQYIVLCISLLCASELSTCHGLLL